VSAIAEYLKRNARPHSTVSLPNGMSAVMVQADGQTHERAAAAAWEYCRRIGAPVDQVATKAAYSSEYREQFCYAFFHEVLRDDRARSDADLRDPYPRRIADSIDELRAAFTPEQMGEITQIYADWAAERRPSGDQIDVQGIIAAAKKPEALSDYAPSTLRACIPILVALLEASRTTR